jgi:ABC-type transport system involved in multi-copper enzyme maturation permease subunit
MAMSAYFTNLYGLSYGDFTLGRLAGVLLSLGRTTFVVIPFVFLALFFATIWRSAGQAVGFALGFFFLEGIFTSLLDNARGLLSHVPDAMLNINAMGVMHANGSYPGSQDRGGPFSGPVGPAAWVGAAVLGAWMAAFVVATFWRFLRRDIGE